MSDSVKEITPGELLEKLEANEPVQVIDVREVDEWIFAASHRRAGQRDPDRDGMPQWGTQPYGH
jgi:hypothetical protein